MTPKISKLTKISQKQPKIRAAIDGKGEARIAMVRQTKVPSNNI